MSMTTTEAAAPKVAEAPAPIRPNIVPMAQTPWAMASDIYSTPEAFEHAQRVAKSFAASALVPDHLRKNPADALAALGLARAMNEHPLLIMQNIFFVSGKAGWSVQFMIARANKAKAFRGRITWDSKGEGKELQVTAKAVLADTGEIVSATVSMQMAIAEDWVRNKKYATMPEHMLRWRSAAMLIRLYAPDVMFGLPTFEEIEDAPQMRDVSPAGPRSVGDALDAFAGTTVQAEEAEVETTEDAGEQVLAEEAIAEVGEFAVNTTNKIIAELNKLNTDAEIKEYEAMVTADLNDLPLSERQRYAAAKVARQKALKAKK